LPDQPNKNVITVLYKAGYITTAGVAFAALALSINLCSRTQKLEALQVHQETSSVSQDLKGSGIQSGRDTKIEGGLTVVSPLTGKPPKRAQKLPREEQVKNFQTYVEMIFLKTKTPRMCPGDLCVSNPTGATLQCGDYEFGWLIPFLHEKKYLQIDEKDGCFEYLGGNQSKKVSE